jgi:hypothetical protein
MSFRLNPLTGQLDLITIFDPNKILTHQSNILGDPLVNYDLQNRVYVNAGPSVVIDNNGNIVVAG